jgi:glycosyltransferase involved in cell wall biosynthesis
MHSSLPEQLSNFRYSSNRLLVGLFDRAERAAVRGSDAVIVICPHLRDVVSRIDGEKPCFLIENSPLAESDEEVNEEDRRRIREELGLADAFVLLYTGTFESYQGLPLLYDAYRLVADELPEARLLLVGGSVEQVEQAKREVRERGLADRVVFTGQRPPGEIPRYLAAGDVLVSPRSNGTNTPLKIYSYLHAGKPIVATRLLTHTQVLDDESAVLTEPTAEAFASAIVALAREPGRQRELSAAARRVSEERYSYERYLERTRKALEFVAEKLGPARSESATVADGRENA